MGPRPRWRVGFALAFVPFTALACGLTVRGDPQNDGAGPQGRRDADGATLSPGEDANGKATAPPPHSGAPGEVLPPKAGWTKRMKLSLDNTGAELTDFPLQVLLIPSRIAYASVRPNGADLRFTDLAGKLLAHEIEVFNPQGATLIWVRAPVLAANAKTELWLYWANDGAVDVQSPADVWSGGYVGVWHLADMNDATGKHRSTRIGAAPTSSLRTGVPSPAMHFEGSAIDTGASEHLTAWTIETWACADGSAVAGSTPTEPISRGGNYQLQWSCGDSDFCRTVNISTGGLYRGASLGNLGPDVFHHLVGTYDGTELVAYVDGVRVSVANVGGPPRNDGVNALIARGTLGPTYYFRGDLDEVRISSVARSAHYIAMQHRSMTDTLLTYGPEEAAP